MSTTPNQTVRVLYTAEATATGGRRGHGRTSDGRVDVDFSYPTELGGDGPARIRSSCSRPASRPAFRTRS